MREFFEPDATTDGTARVSVTPAYAELELPFPSRGALVAYLTADDQRYLQWIAGAPTACSFTAQTCVDQMLAPFAMFMQDSARGDDWAEVFFRSFPVLDELYRDSAADQLANGG